MTNQEAIKRIEYLKNKAEISLNNTNTSCEWLKKDVAGTITAFSTAIEALEKQIPKKPNYVYEDEPLCPYCGAVLDYCESPCEDCNQFIDWSDEE